MHPKLQAAYAVIPAPQDDTEALRVAIIRGLLFGYHHRWLDEPWQVHEIESEFHVPIFNPDTRRPSRHFTHAGKVDGLVSRDGRTYLLEHKTCRDDLGPDSPYWKRLTIDTQISGYLLARWHLGQRLDGVLYDVIRKPEIRPRKLSDREEKQLTITRRYCGSPLDDTAYELWRKDPASRETPAMFEARLAQDTLARPDWYFARRIIVRLDQELLTYARELWQTAREMHLAERAQDRRRNDRACMAYDRPCEYLDVCAGHDRLDNPRWKKLVTIHPELEDVTDGHRTLTHSRIASFATCRRKHHYRYELGLTRWEEAEPLALGHLLHQALAAWWQSESAGPGPEAAPAPRGYGPDPPAPGPRAPARRPGRGEDESGRAGPEPPLPHDEE